MFALRRASSADAVTFLPARTIGSGPRALDIEVDLHADQAGWTLLRHLDHQASVFDADLVGHVKRAQHVFVGKRSILHSLFQVLNHS